MVRTMAQARMVLSSFFFISCFPPCKIFRPSFAAVAAALAQAKGEAPVGGDEEDGTLDLPFDQADAGEDGAE